MVLPGAGPSPFRGRDPLGPSDAGGGGVEGVVSLGGLDHFLGQLACLLGVLGGHLDGLHVELPTGMPSLHLILHAVLGGLLHLLLGGGSGSLGLGGFLRLGLLLLLLLGCQLLLGYHPGLQQAGQHLGVPLGLGHPEFLELAGHQLHADGLVDFALGGIHGHHALDVEPGQIPVAGVLAVLDAHGGQVVPLAGVGLGGQGLHGDAVAGDTVGHGHLGHEGGDIRGYHGHGILRHVGLGLVGGLAGVGLGPAVGGVVQDPIGGGVVHQPQAEGLPLGGLVGVGGGGPPSLRGRHGQQVFVGAEEVSLQDAVRDFHGQLVGAGHGVGGVGVHRYSPFICGRVSRHVGWWYRRGLPTRLLYHTEARSVN